MLSVKRIFRPEGCLILARTPVEPSRTPWSVSSCASAHPTPEALQTTDPARMSYSLNCLKGDVSGIILASTIGVHKGNNTRILDISSHTFSWEGGADRGPWTVKIFW